MFVKCNVTIPEDWTRVWDEAERTLGGKIHLLLNNAGINPTVIEFFLFSFFNQLVCFAQYSLTARESSLQWEGIYANPLNFYGLSLAATNRLYLFGTCFCQQAR